jgi:hypothetical protein
LPCASPQRALVRRSWDDEQDRTHSTRMSSSGSRYRLRGLPRAQFGSLCSRAAVRRHIGGRHRPGGCGSPRGERQRRSSRGIRNSKTVSSSDSRSVPERTPVLQRCRRFAGGRCRGVCQQLYLSSSGNRALTARATAPLRSCLPRKAQTRASKDIAHPCPAACRERPNPAPLSLRSA